jgi:hypothetical protein
MLVRMVLAILLATFFCWLFSILRARLVNKPVSYKNGEIVACSHCSLYIPLKESIVRDERPYCSVKHADLGDKK